MFDFCYFAKNYCMDWILLAICIFYFVKGYFKGLISMAFSLIGTFAVIYIAWKLTPNFVGYVQNWFGDNLFSTLQKTFDNMISGEFSSASEFQTALLQTNIGKIFGLFLSSFFENITFDGTMTAGQILAPTLCELILKVVTFLVLFIFLICVLKFLSFLLNKLIKIFGFQHGNKILGGLFGTIKGILVFGVIYMVMVSIANFTLNVSLQSFVQSGIVCNFLYENLTSKIVNLFY